MTKCAAAAARKRARQRGSGRARARKIGGIERAREQQTSGAGKGLHGRLLRGKDKRRRANILEKRTQRERKAAGRRSPSVPGCWSRRPLPFAPCTCCCSAPASRSPPRGLLLPPVAVLPAPLSTAPASEHVVLPSPSPLSSATSLPRLFGCSV